MFETIIIIGVILVGWLLLNIKYGILPRSPKGLRILTYRQISVDGDDVFSITVEQLKKQFNYLKKRQYNIISFKDVLRHIDTNTILPRKSVVLTFEGGYQSNCELLYPLLIQYDYKATIFVPVKYIGGSNDWEGGTEKIINEHAILNTEGDLISYGLCSYAHKNYSLLTIPKMEEDIKYCVENAVSKNIPYVKVFAYPDGQLPIDTAQRSTLIDFLIQYDFRLALKSGNNVNRFPFTNPFELNRIDIKGIDTFFEFKKKLKKGLTKVI